MITSRTYPIQCFDIVQRILRPQRRLTRVVGDKTAPCQRNRTKQSIQIDTSIDSSNMYSWYNNRQSIDRCTNVWYKDVIDDNSLDLKQTYKYIYIILYSYYNIYSSCAGHIVLQYLVSYVFMQRSSSTYTGQGTDKSASCKPCIDNDMGAMLLYKDMGVIML